MSIGKYTQPMTICKPPSGQLECSYCHTHHNMCSTTYNMSLQGQLGAVVQQQSKLVDILTLFGFSAVLQQNGIAIQDWAKLKEHCMIYCKIWPTCSCCFVWFPLNNIFEEHKKNALSVHKIIIFNVENLRVAQSYLRNLMKKKNCCHCIVLISLCALCFTRSEVIAILSSHTEAESTKCLCANGVAVSESQSLCLQAV